MVSDRELVIRQVPVDRRQETNAVTDVGYRMTSGDKCGMLLGLRYPRQALT